jgi:hypothetical protein
MPRRGEWHEAPPELRCPRCRTHEHATLWCFEGGSILTYFCDRCSFLAQAVLGRDPDGSAVSDMARAIGEEWRAVRRGSRVAGSATRHEGNIMSGRPGRPGRV